MFRKTAKFLVTTTEDAKTGRLADGAHRQGTGVSRCLVPAFDGLD
jgi:hypothetical protein